VGNDQARGAEEAEPSLDLQFNPGDVIADVYEVRSVLGSGAMGAVYDAHDRVLNRRVALKFALEARYEQSLLLEGQGLAAVHHAGLASIYTVGRHDGLSFLVMERVPGLSLRAHLGRIAAGARFPIEEAITVCRSIAETLAVVHRAGLAHRDVKPDNIILSSRGRVVLVDFGLVLPEFAIAAERRLVGTPSYMAPEALSGVAAGAGHLLDVYALGAVLFELVAGKRPYSGATFSEVLMQHVASPVPDLAAESGLGDQLPHGLAALVQEMMAKDPAERPASTEIVAARLEQMMHAPGPARMVIAAPILQQIIGGPATSGSPIAVTTPAPAMPADEAPRAFTVLIVEDEPNIRQLMGMYVKMAQPLAEIRFADDGGVAISMLREHVPDLVLLDLHMPRVNGTEVCMYLRGAGVANDAAIVIVSAGAQEHDIELLRHLGIDGFLFKGRDTFFKELVVVVNRIAELADARRRALSA
jgi:CheY-like chemotaxis protein/predicted Ser/Thr protein kinase